MNTQEVKITPPEGFEIDKEHSTLECIKFKPIAKRWREDKKAKFNGYHITDFSEIIEVNDMDNVLLNHDIYATAKQAISALAMARISQIIANDSRFGGAITDKEWNNDNFKYTIRRLGDKICPDFNIFHYTFLAFHTKEQRDLFLEENEDLVKDYLMIE